MQEPSTFPIMLEKRTLDHRLVTRTRLDCEWPVLDICLDAGVVKLAADQTLRVEDSVDGVHGHLQDTNHVRYTSNNQIVHSNHIARKDCGNCSPGSLLHHRSNARCL